MNLPPDVSENELKLQQLDRRDLRWRGFGLFVLCALVVINVLTLTAIWHSINQNQKDAIAARDSNKARQVESQRYIKCIILIRYDNPELNQNSPRADVERALDRCASNTAAQ